MSCLSCHHITLASSTSPETNQNPPLIRTKKPSKNKRNQFKLSTKVPSNPNSNPNLKLSKQLAIMEMERAIGAGSFRDNEPRDFDKKKIEFDGVLPDFSKVFEGSVQKQIREAGEWVATNAEQKIRSSRKGILLVFMQWILPIWTLSLLLASGAVKLPFSIPLIDNLIM